MKNSKHSRIIFYNFIIIIIILVNSSLSYSDFTNKNNNIIFNWSFVALIGPENNKNLINVNEKNTLKTGDQLKIMINNKSECFIYILYHGSNGEIMSLYPVNTKKIQIIILMKNIIFLQETYGSLWMNTLVRETFYLIASKERLNNLEILINKYQGVGF